MTVVKALALAIGFLGFMTLGVWIGPHLAGRGAPAVDYGVAAADTPTAPLSEPSAAPAKSLRTTPTERRARARTITAVIAPTAPELHMRLKPLLNRGADMTLAAAGFRDGEQFASLAHAARNTEVPFMLLKHRVLNQGQTLSAAIHQSKPVVNAVLEANRARAEAKADLAALGW